MLVQRLEQTENNRRDESHQGTLPPPERSFTLFDDARAVAVLTSKERDPEFVERLGRFRRSCFAKEAAPDENYGLDKYDEYYQQLVVFDKSSGRIIAGTRLGVGEDILGEYGWERLYSARYWVFRDGMVDVARRGVEAGRTWVNPLYQKRFTGLALLWKALALFLDRRKAAFFFGVVSLTGYPPESERLVMNYLWHYHRSATDLVVARSPLPLKDYGAYAARHEGIPSGRALRKLQSNLGRIHPEYPVPVLLRHYAKSGAELGGGFASDPEGVREDKVAALLLASSARLRPFIDRFGSL